MALVEQLGDGSWYRVCGNIYDIVYVSVCAGCCHMAMFLSIPFLTLYFILLDGMVDDISIS